LAGGSVTCWGSADRDLAGDSVETLLSPTVVPGISSATSVAVGGDHACALLAAGTVRCWGLGASGQLGDGTLRGYTTSPVTVTGVVSAPARVVAKGISSARSITSSAAVSCAVLQSGRVACWGAGYAAEGGTFLSGVQDAVQVEGGCLVRVAGTVACWGWNAFG